MYASRKLLPFLFCVFLILPRLKHRRTFWWVWSVIMAYIPTVDVGLIDNASLSFIDRNMSLCKAYLRQHASPAVCCMPWPDAWYARTSGEATFSGVLTGGKRARSQFFFIRRRLTVHNATMSHATLAQHTFLLQMLRSVRCHKNPTVLAVVNPNPPHLVFVSFTLRRSKT